MGPLHLLRSSRWAVAVAVVASIASGACTTLLLSLIQRSLAAAAPDRSLAPQFAVLCAAFLASQTLCRVLLVRAGHEAVFRLRLAIAEVVIAAPLRRVEALGAHRLLAALTEDVLAVADAVPELQSLIAQAAIAMGCLAYIVWLSWPLALALVALAALGTLTYLLPLKVALAALRRARAGQDTLFQHIAALVGGLKELKLHRPRRAAFMSGALRASADEVRRESSFGMTVFMVAASWGQTQYLVAVGLLLFVLPWVVTTAPGATAGVIVAVLYLAVPLELILSAAPVLGRASVALHKLRALDLGREDALVDAPGGVPRPRWRELALRGVTYGHTSASEARPFTVGPIDLTLRPGEIVFFIGGNGSGKTTLAKLVTGLYAPDRGEVAVDDVVVTDATRDDHRQRFSAVFVDSHLFASLHGIASADLRATELLRRFALDQKVSVRAGAFSTTALSQGQRRRLMLLVACLEDREVYVFDEWAADQDPEFRELFYTDVLPGLRAQGKCVLVVSHDDRFFHLADRVIRLDDGQLSELGGAATL